MSFFKRVSNAVETVGKDISKAAKDSAEISKCEVEVERCQNLIDETYKEIGKQFFEKNAEITAVKQGGVWGYNDEL